MPISPHISISIIPLAARRNPNLLFSLLHRSPPTPTLLLNPPNRLPPPHCRRQKLPIPIPIRNHTPSPQLRRPRSSTIRFSIAALPAQHGRLVFFPVALSPVEATVLGPEEKPDAGEDERGAEQGEEREDAFVVDGAWVEGSLAGSVEGGGWGGGGGGGAGGEEGGGDVIAIAALEEGGESRTCR